MKTSLFARNPVSPLPDLGQFREARHTKKPPQPKSPM
jgi:hypothetical protein